MGFTPEQVWRMTPWEFMACLDELAQKEGWKLGSGDKPMSLERLHELGIE